jgi:uncharacterized protein (DUF2336 family)
MQNATASIFDELDQALLSGSSEQRVTILRRVTDLFLIDADRFSEEQIAVFDNVLCHLIDQVEARALAQISQSLAPIENAPLDVTLRLARHEEIRVAGPILTSSKRLTTEHLIDIASTHSQQHLLAISHRDHLESGVTDVLLDRGNRAVVHRVASNAGAQISEEGFEKLLKAAANDEALAEKTGLRLDIPLRMLKELLLRATEAVRARLLPRVPADMQEAIQKVLSDVADEVERQSSKQRSYEGSFRVAKLLHERGELTDARLRQSAIEHHYEDTVAGLAVLCSLTIDIVKPLMDSPREEGLLIACKGAGVSWPTTLAILNCRIASGTLQPETSARLETEFGKLSRPNAERLLRFWRVRQIN